MGDKAPAGSRRAPCRSWLVMAVLGVLLTSCGAAETPASPTSSAAPDPAPSTTALPSPSIGEQPSDALLERARDQLARYLSLAPDAVTLESATSQEWPTGALGCPVPGQTYIQVITPGYLLIFSANNQHYAIHTSHRSDTLILCLNGRPTRLDSSP